MQQRPVFLNLLQIRLPISGVMSILHRISGVLMVFLAAFFVWALGESLNGEEGYRLVVGLFGTVPGKLFLFLFLWMLLHHLFSGFRFLLIDVEIGVEKAHAKNSAWAVMIASPLVAMILMVVI